MACTVDQSPPSLAVWTGELLHKRQLLARLTAKASTTLTVELPESLHVQQKIQFEKFATLLLPSTIQDSSTQLSCDHQYFCEGGRAFQPCVLACEDTRGKWSRFADFLHKDNSVGVATTQGRTLEDSVVCLFLIPVLLLYPYLDEKSNGTSERIFGLFSWHLDEDGSEGTDPEPNVTETRTQSKMMVGAVSDQPAVPAKAATPEPPVKPEDSSEKNLDDGILKKTSSLDINSTSMTAQVEKHPSDEFLDPPKMSGLNITTVESKSSEIVRSPDNEVIQPPQHSSLASQSSETAPSGAKMNMENGGPSNLKSFIHDIASVGLNPANAGNSVESRFLQIPKGFSLGISGENSQLASVQLQQVHSDGPMDDCMPSTTHMESITNAADVCTRTATIGSDGLVEHISVLSSLQSKCNDDISLEKKDGVSTHVESEISRDAHGESNDQGNAGSFGDSQEHLSLIEKSGSRDKVGKGNVKDNLRNLQPNVRLKILTSKHSNKNSRTSNSKQNYTSKIVNLLGKNNNDMEGQWLRPTMEQCRPHPKKMPTIVRKKLPSVNRHHARQHKRHSTETLGVFHDHEFNDPFDYDLMQMSPHPLPTKLSTLTDDASELPVQAYPEVSAAGTMSEVISSRKNTEITVGIARKRDPRLVGKMQTEQTGHNPGSTDSLCSTNIRTHKRKISYEDYVSKHPKPIKKEDFGQQTDTPITREVGFMADLKKATSSVFIQVSDPTKRKDLMQELQQIAMKQSVLGALGALTSSLRSGMTITTQITAILTLEKIIDIITRTARFDLEEMLREETENSMVFLEGGDKIIAPSLVTVSSSFSKDEALTKTKTVMAVEKQSGKIKKNPQCSLFQESPKKYTSEAAEILKPLLIGQMSSDNTNLSVPLESVVPKDCIPSEKSQYGVPPHTVEMHPENIINEPGIPQQSSASQLELFNERSSCYSDTYVMTSTPQKEQDRNAAKTWTSHQTNTHQPENYQNRSLGQLEVSAGKCDIPPQLLDDNNTDNKLLNPDKISDLLNTSINGTTVSTELCSGNISNPSYPSHSSGTTQLKISQPTQRSPVVVSDLTQTKLLPSPDKYIPVGPVVKITPDLTKDQLDISTGHFSHPVEKNDSPASPDPEPKVEVELNAPISSTKTVVISSICETVSVSQTVQTASETCNNSCSSALTDNVKADHTSDMKETCVNGMVKQESESDSLPVRIKIEKKETLLESRDGKTNHECHGDAVHEKNIDGGPQRCVEIIYEPGYKNQESRNAKQVKCEKGNDVAEHFSSRQNAHDENIGNTLVEKDMHISEQHEIVDNKEMENHHGVKVGVECKRHVTIIDNEDISERHLGLSEKLENSPMKNTIIPKQNKKMLTIDDVPVAKLRESRKRHVEIIYKQEHQLEKLRRSSSEAEENSLCSSMQGTLNKGNPSVTHMEQDEKREVYSVIEVAEDISCKHKSLSAKPQEEHLNDIPHEVHSKDYEDHEFNDLQDIRKVTVQQKRPSAPMLKSRNMGFYSRQDEEERTVIDTSSNIQITLTKKPASDMDDKIDVITKCLHSTDVTERRFIVVGGELPVRERSLDTDSYSVGSGTSGSKKPSIKESPDRNKARDSSLPPCELISSEDDVSVGSSRSSSSRKIDTLNKVRSKHTARYKCNKNLIGRDHKSFRKEVDKSERAGLGKDQFQEQSLSGDRLEGNRIVADWTEDRTEADQLPRGYRQPLIQRKVSPDRSQMRLERQSQQFGVGYLFGPANGAKIEKPPLETHLERFFNFVTTWQNGTCKTLQIKANQWHTSLTYIQRNFSSAYEKRLTIPSYLFHWDQFSMSMPAAKAKLGELSIATAMATYISVSCVYEETMKRIGKRRVLKSKDELFDLMNQLDKVRFKMKNLCETYMAVPGVGKHWLKMIPDMCSACTQKAETITKMLEEIQQEDLKKCRDSENHEENEKGKISSQNSSLKGILPRLLELQKTVISRSKTQPQDLKALVPGIIHQLEQLEKEIPENLKEHLKETIESFKDGPNEFHNTGSLSLNDGSNLLKGIQKEQQGHDSMDFWHKNLEMAEDRMARECVRNELSDADFGEAAKRSRQMAEDKSYLNRYRRVPGTKHHIHASEFLSHESSSTCSSGDRVQERGFPDQGYYRKASWNQQRNSYGDGDYHKRTRDQNLEQCSKTWDSCDEQDTDSHIDRNTISNKEDSLDREQSPPIENVPWRKQKVKSKLAEVSKSEKKSIGGATSLEDLFVKKKDRHSIEKKVCVLSEEPEVAMTMVDQTTHSVEKQAHDAETRSNISFSIGTGKPLMLNKSITPTQKRSGLNVAMKESHFLGHPTNDCDQRNNPDSNEVFMATNKRNNALLDLSVKYRKNRQSVNEEVSDSDSDSSLSDKNSGSDSSGSDSSSIDQTVDSLKKNESHEDSSSSDSDSDSGLALMQMPKKYNNSIDIAGRKYVQIVSDKRKRCLAKAVPVPPTLQQYVDNPLYRAGMCSMRLRCHRIEQCWSAHTPEEMRKNLFKELRVHELEDHTLWIDAENVWRLHNC